MNKILIAVNESANAAKAVEYVARQFGGSTTVEIGVVYVLPNLPAIFWDEGHILSDSEKQDRKKVVDTWLASEKTKMEPVLKKSVASLSSKGVPSDRIRTKFVSDSTDVAASILEEARDGGSGTIVVGRSHHSPQGVLGTVAGRIASHGSGLAVTIVE